MKFLTGASAHEEMVKADIERQAQYAPFRFWIKEGQVTKITFLDGALLENGLLSLTSFYEHMIPKGPGRKGFDNYYCIKEKESCPICEEGEFSQLVSAFTVLDHTTFTDKNDKVHKDTKRLYVCRGDTVKRLQQKAQMYGGLVGVTFQVARIGKTSASVGSDYDYIAKTPLEEIAKVLNIKLEDLSPMDYSKEIKELSAQELRKIGFGTVGAGTSVGSADTAQSIGGNSNPFATGGNAAPPVTTSSPFDPAKHM